MILHLDLISGISGDMCLGALVDLGVDPAWLEARLIPLFKGFSIQTTPVFRNGLRAVDLTVTVTDHKISRTYPEIRTLIQESDLPSDVINNSLTAFEKIARAEAGIHGRDMESVHFHEVGGIDSLVDILGTFLSIHHLGVTQVTASQVPLGSGFMDCAHGRIPVPVPATLAILEGIPVTGSDAATEIVTPTGAALVATLVKKFGPVPSMRPAKIGYGAGKRETQSRIPNLLRLILGHPPEKMPEPDIGFDDENHGMRFFQPPVFRDKIAVITTLIDDMNPQISGFVMDHLLEKGALDVSFAPVHMKKNRPGIRMEVLCKPGDLEFMIQEIFLQTTTIGVRYHFCDRAVLDREPARMKTVFGYLDAKKIKGPDGRNRLVPEFESLARVARQQEIPLQDVYTQVFSGTVDGWKLP